jgi:hypothetical protein
MTLRNSGLDDDDNDDKQVESRYNISSLKPSGDEVEEKIPINQKDYWTSMEQTRLAIKEKGYDVGLYNETVLGGNTRLGENIPARNFFSKVDLNKGEIDQKIITMHRRKALQFYKDSKGREKSRIKEFLTYNIELRGFDWLQNPISCKLEHEGLAQEPESRISITTDNNGRQTAQYVFNKLRNKFYIEFSKSAVDSLIKKTGSDKHSIKYYGFIGSDADETSIKFRCDAYNYDQFVQPWDQFIALAKRDGGPSGKSHWVDKKQDKVWVD